MRGGIAIGERPVGGRRHDPPIGIDDHSPDGHFACGRGFGGKLEGMAHGGRQDHAAL
jgi:hypothetical protein